jgi:hypothetical protein
MDPENNGSQSLRLTRDKVRAILNAMDEGNVPEVDIYRATDGRIVVRQVIVKESFKALKVS